MKNRLAREIKNIILGLSLVFFISFFPQISRAQNINRALSFIRTPVDISQWFSKEFKYQTEMPDYWQNAEETLKLKTGDCEDFAILAQTILRKLNINSDIIIINFKGLSQAHAVCIFKEGNNYSFISNRQLIRTSGKTIQAAVSEQYSDWETITFSDAKKQYSKVITRDDNQASQEESVDIARNDR